MPLRPTIECPIDQTTREWIDRRWQWLCRQFGEDRVRKAQVILPKPEFFPEAYHGTPEDAVVVMGRVADYMALDRSTVVLRVYADDRPRLEGRHEGSRGMYFVENGEFQICVEAGTLDDPADLVATLAHELAHVHLLGHGRIREEEEDHEPLTDLLTVFLGLGVFTANSVLREKYWQEGHYAGWSIGRGGYLSMTMYGYALARFAQSRGEADPPWADALRLDVRSAMRQSLKLFREEFHCDVTYAPQIGLQTTRPVEPKGEESPEVSDGTVCTFCQAPLDDDEEEGVCRDCQDSMHESDTEDEGISRSEHALGHYNRYVGVVLMIIVLAIVLQILASFL